MIASLGSTLLNKLRFEEATVVSIERQLQRFAISHLPGAYILLSDSGKLVVQLGSIYEDYGDYIFSGNRFTINLSQEERGAWRLLCTSELPVSLPVEFAIVEASIALDDIQITNVRLFR